MAVLRNGTAMYRAKGQGRNSYQVFDERMHAGVVAMLQIENDLRHALERAALAVYYQPIIRLSDSAVIGLEALVRWPHPARGLVSPADFIPVAEDTGLIVPLDQWVLGEACRQLAAWRARGIVPEGTSVSSNVSSRAFNRGNIVATVESALAATAIPPSCLKVEITESAIIDNPESAKAMLEKLKGLGVHLSIDDFGTGYSSLSYLHSFPFDNLKIDRAFVARMGPSGENWEIVHAIINIANSLRMEVIAEGIETAEQYQTLQSLGCDAGQGYYMARPMPADGVEEFLRERS
ncbi:MAG: EAL domain-containing protein [Acidobacteriota bacterium]